jgi:hypothetical protein
LAFAKLLSGARALCDVPDNSLDTDEGVLRVVDWRLDHAHILQIPREERYIFFVIEAPAGLDNFLILSAILVSQLGRNKFVGILAYELLEGLPKLLKEALVTERESGMILPKGAKGNVLHHQWYSASDSRSASSAFRRSISCQRCTSWAASRAEA